MLERGNKNSFESAIKGLSLIYLLLVILGLCYSYFFYKNFGLTITEYIDFSDALLLFLPLLADSVGITIIGSIVLSFMMKEFCLNERFLLFFGARFKEKVFAYFAVGVLFFLTLSAIAFFTKDTEFIYSGLVMLGVFFPPVFLDVFLEKIDFQIPIITKQLLYVLIIALTIVIWRSHTANLIVNDKRHIKNFTILFKDSSRLNNEHREFYYLGRTKSFIFIYDFKWKCSRVFNVGDIKQFIVAK